MEITCGVCGVLSGQERAHKRFGGIAFVGLWYSSSSCLLQKGADRCSTALLLPLYDPRYPYTPVLLSCCSGLSPGNSSTLATLCWETHQTVWTRHEWMFHPGGALSVTVRFRFHWFKRSLPIPSHVNIPPLTNFPGLIWTNGAYLNATHNTPWC